MSASYTYFPGCAMKGTGRAYHDSLVPVFHQLGLELEELDDWNCCGATAYMAIDEIKACALASRNLAMAEKLNRPMLAPCSACYLVLNKTNHYLQEAPAVAEVVRKALKSIKLDYGGKTIVRHPLDLLVNEIGLDEVKKHVKRPLTGLKVIPYYGCQIVRPYATFDDQRDPTTMDRLIEALGATVQYYPLKTRCCGGSLTGTLPEPGLMCSYILLKEAVKRGGDVIVTVCPLCHFNLDSYRDHIAAKWERLTIPVLFFTQLMALAFDLSDKETALWRLIQPMIPLPAVPAAAAAA